MSANLPNLLTVDRVAEEKQAAKKSNDSVQRALRNPFVKDEKDLVCESPLTIFNYHEEN
jgi:hypothetical protein